MAGYFKREKIAKQVSREKNNSGVTAKHLILKKMLLSIINYLNYTATNQPDYFLKGFENVSQTKLLIQSFNNNRLNITKKSCLL
jgi:hypothetical protein